VEAWRRGGVEQELERIVARTMEKLFVNMAKTAGR